MHPGEYVVGQQAHILGKHAENQPVDEMRHRLRVVSTFPQRLRQRCESFRRTLGQRLSALARTQTVGIGHRPLELVSNGRVGEIVQRELVLFAHAVGPIGADAEPRHIRNDQQRRVLQRQRVLPELGEGGVQVRMLALVFPGEAVPLPHVGPAVAAGVLARSAFEAVAVAGRVGFGRCWLAQQLAQVDEVFLRRRTLLQFGSAPLGDELVRRHERIQPTSRTRNGDCLRLGSARLEGVSIDDYSTWRAVRFAERDEIG